MIAVDTSAWIDHLKDIRTPQVVKLCELIVSRLQLHSDRDFEPMAEHLGLAVLRV